MDIFHSPPKELIKVLIVHAEVVLRETRIPNATPRRLTIASNLAKGMAMPAAVKAGCRYVQAGIRSAPGFGRGNGPLNHFHSVYALPFSP